MMNTKAAVVFSILMENHDGILGKAPKYIEEKLKMCEQLDEPWRLLDSGNLNKYARWCELWLGEIQNFDL